MVRHCLMNPASDMENPPSPADTGYGREPGDAIPSNWREALLTLISSRVTLIQLETKDAARDTGRRAARLAGVLFCAFFTWALLLAGGIAALSKTTGLPWYAVALALAALHLLMAIIFAKAARTPAAPAFPVTRAEFQKDREWIENFQKTPKSGA